MKNAFLLLTLGLFAECTLAVPTFDPFADATANGGTTYAAGTALTNNALNATSPWNTIGAVNGPTSVEPTVLAGSLTYAGLPPSTGNSAGFYSAVAKGARLNLNGPITSANKAFYSYILKITDISNVPTTAANNYFAGLSDTTVAQSAALARVGSRVLTKKVGASYVLGISKTANTGDMVFDTTTHNVNDVLFVVGSYEVIGTVTNCNLWINPPVSTFGSNLPPAPTVTATLHSGGNSALNT